MNDDLLFARGDLRASLEHELQRLDQAVHDWEPDQLLATAETDVVDYLVDAHRVICPMLHRDEIHQFPPAETVESVQGWSGRRLQIRKTKIVIAVPFDGEKDVFHLRASTYSTSQPYADVTANEIRLTWIGDGATIDAEGLRKHFDDRLDKIEERLTWARQDIDDHNTRVAQAVKDLVAQRRARLLADRQLQAGLGFPIRQRTDAPKYATPVARRKVTARPRPTASGPYTPEPTLPEAQYEAALDVLINMRNALERAPSTTAKLTEEGIRDLLLVALNAQFEGKAAGEVFNGAGKTDILIRAEDRNVFIAECKIWKGPKTMGDALDQLLSYLVWRDTKAALLLFIRRGEPTSIISKAIPEIESHPNCKRTINRTHPGERYDFVLHANGDPNQEIRLAFLPFALRAGNSNE